MLPFLEAPGSWHLGSGQEKAFQIYKACMDAGATEAAGAGPLGQGTEEVRPRASTFLDTNVCSGLPFLYLEGASLS